MNGHLSDETLLLLDEQELSPRAMRHAERHLVVCAGCRERQMSLWTATASLREMAEHAPVDAGRERLRQGMQDEPVAGGGRRTWSPERWNSQMFLRLGAVAAVLVLAVTWRTAYRPLQERLAAYKETGPQPNHALTPGAVSAADLAELCALNDEDLDPKVTPEKERAVFRAYGMDEHAAYAYQVDYLINPQLGGNDSLENLWPEPYHATVWNAAAKDALETRLHGMVCSHQIALDEAQRDLSTDWIAAYKKYFHASRPVGGMVAAVDSPF